MEKVLVTGANGFLGLRFCRILSEKGYGVRALVRKSEAAKELNGIAEVNVMSAPWDKNLLEPVLEGVNAVIHLAGRAHIINDKPENAGELFRKANVDTTRALLEAASGKRVTRFLFASSVMAMGLTSGNILTEEDSCGPSTPYGQSKLEAEKVVRGLAERSKIQRIILRLPLVYGPGNRANMLKLFQMVSKGLPIPLGSVSNRRSFIYIDNAVEAALAALECPLAGGETFLVSDGQDVSTREFLSAIAKALNRPCRLISVPLPLLWFMGTVGSGIEKVFNCNLGINAGAMERLMGSLAVDSGKIRRITGWAPRYSLSDGLRVTAEWFLKNKKVAKC